MSDAVLPMPMRSRASDYARVLIPAALVLIAGALLHSYAPAALHLPECPFHAMTRLYCPGCGSTRALHHLLNLEFITALRCNLLAVVGLPFVLAHFALTGARRLGWTRGKLGNLKFDPSANTIMALVVLVVVWSIVRNLPFAIFNIPPQ
jgi:hypothetical protein